MKNIKSYLVFTSFPYRVAMFLLVPAVLAGISLWGSSLGDVALMVAALLLSSVEIISDNWLFGGIQAKELGRLDYLKTSYKGKGVMRNALIMDMIRKFISSVWVLAICKAAVWLARGVSEAGAEDVGFWDVIFYGAPGTGGGKEGVGIFLCMTAICYFFSAAGTYVSRYGSMLWSNLLISYVVMGVEILGFCLPGLLQYAFWYALLFIVLGFMVSVLAVRTAMKRMEESYYDK